MNSPCVSILMNVYNGGTFASETIRSVLNQTCRDFELIIVDDASIDNTPEILRSFQDERIKLIQNTCRRHIPCGANQALSHAEGQWIAWIDADDLWEQDKLEKQLAYLNEHPQVGVCFSYADVINENGQPVEGAGESFHTAYPDYTGWVRHFFYQGNCLCHSSSLVRRDLLDSYNLFCRQQPDFELWCRLVTRTGFYVLPEELVHHRICGIDESGIGMPSEEAAQRAENEAELACRRQLLTQLSDAQLAACFRQDFRRQESETPLEMQIERAFLLCRGSRAEEKTTAFSLDAFRALLQQPEALSVLERDYGFNLLEFYQRTAEPVFFTPAMRKQLQDNAELACSWAEQDSLLSQLDQANAVTANLSAEIEALRHSFSWRVTAPLRRMTGGLRRVLIRMPRLMLIAKGLKSLLNFGPRATLARMRGWRARQKVQQRVQQRMKSRMKHMPDHFCPASFGCSEEHLQAQRQAQFPRQIKFSILVPLYNTPLSFLQEMIQSVQFQTYSNWELCLADGSDTQHPEVGETCLKMAESDPRIRYKKLEKNLGISGNTNACIEMATGEYIALFDHDDLLHPSVLFEDMKVICEQNADFIYTDEATFESPDLYRIITIHHKPDYAPDTLRGNNYICHFSAFSRVLLDRAGYFLDQYNGSQDHDLILRLTECAEKVVHIPRVLYYWRSHPQSVAMDINSKTYAIEAGKRAVHDSALRQGYETVVSSTRAFPTIYRLEYTLKTDGLVSIIIPNKNHKMDLQRCLTSVFQHTTYPNYEIIIVDNGSTDTDLLQYYKQLEDRPRVRIVYDDIPFNFSALNNFAVSAAKGEYLLLLNNDISVITPNWIEEMLMYAQRPDVGAVGTMLYYPDDTIQHAGIVLGMGPSRTAGHIFYHLPKNAVGYMGRLCYAQNLSAVTAACLMVRKSAWDQVGGMSEELAVAFNDVDFCLRLRQAGYLNVWTPFAELYHYESKSRGRENENPERLTRFEREAELFRTRWKEQLEAGDPYFSPNFSLDDGNFTILEDADPFGE